MNVEGRLNRIKASSADAAEAVKNLIFDILMLSLDIKRQSFELLQDASPEHVDEHQSIIAAARAKLNAIGLFRAQNGQWKDMKMITDLYADLGELLDMNSVKIEREEIGSVAFTRPIQFQKKLEILGATLVRTRESNRSALPTTSVDEKVREGLQLAFRLKRTLSVAEGKFEQGWIGSRDEIQSHYVAGDHGHAIGRMWDGAETHDFAVQASGDWCAKEHVLTFVAQDRRNPVFCSGKFELPAIDDAGELIKSQKSAIGNAILYHLRGATNVAMDGTIS